MADQASVAPAPHYTDYREHYRIDGEHIPPPETLHPTRRWSERRRLEAIVRVLQRARVQGPLLDAGCGSGWLMDLLAKAGFAMMGLDLSLVGVCAARARAPSARGFALGDIYALPYRDGRLGGAVLSEVAEHLVAPDAAFAAVHRVLRPGGHLLVTVPYRERITHHLCIHCNRFTPANAHIGTFSPQSLAEALRRAGFAPYRTLTLMNKGLEVFRVPRLTRWLPHLAWRAFDWGMTRLIPKPAYLLVLATKVP